LITDSDRAFAIEHAAARDGFHVKRNDSSHLISTRISTVESHRRGILGECAFVNRFGGAVDVELRPSGDERDFSIVVFVKGVATRFDVDVKANSYTGPTRYLLVPVDYIKPQTIYVDAQYLEARDDIELMGWAFGKALIKRDQRKALNSRQVLNFVMPIAELRPIAELLARVEIARIIEPLPQSIIARLLIDLPQAPPLVPSPRAAIQTQFEFINGGAP